METPRLIEREVKSYIYYTLNRCRESRVKIYSLLFNCIILIFFIAFFGTALYYSYNKRETSYEKYVKSVKNQKYILSKIHDYQIDMSTKSSLTNLPVTYNPILPKV